MVGPPFILVLSIFILFYLFYFIDVFDLDCGYGLLCFMFIFVVILLFYMILMGVTFNMKAKFLPNTFNVLYFYIYFLFAALWKLLFVECTIEIKDWNKSWKNVKWCKKSIWAAAFCVRQNVNRKNQEITLYDFIFLKRKLLAQTKCNTL